MYICIYIHIRYFIYHIYIYIHNYLHKCTCNSVYMYVCKYIYIYIHMCVCVWTSNEPSLESENTKSFVNNRHIYCEGQLVKWKKMQSQTPFSGSSISSPIFSIDHWTSVAACGTSIKSSKFKSSKFRLGAGSHGSNLVHDSICDFHLHESSLLISFKNIEWSGLVQMWKNTLRIGPGTVLFVLIEFPNQLGILRDSSWNGLPNLPMRKIRTSKWKKMAL